MTEANGNGNKLKLTAKEYRTDQEVRWCPGCGDYAILAAMQQFMPELGIERERTVFVSGIGCAARFPYYMNTYGMHSIHGRAPAIATGLASSRPDLSVWIVTGDGDALFSKVRGIMPDATSVWLRGATLEDVFLMLTGRGLLE